MEENRLTRHVINAIASANMAQESISQSLTFAGAFDQTRDVDDVQISGDTAEKLKTVSTMKQNPNTIRYLSGLKYSHRKSNRSSGTGTRPKKIVKYDHTLVEARKWE